MKEKIEEVPIMETRKPNQEKKKRNIPWGWILLIFFVLVECWFFITWNQQQKVADENIERLLETAVLKEDEELAKEELAFLYENYEDSNSMSLFKEERTTIFLDRARSVIGLEIKDVVLTKYQTEDASFLQLCFVCELEDKVSDSLLYAYRYYENGMQEKYICYAYDTIKSKLFWEDGTGMTVCYNNKGESLAVEGMSCYDDALCDVLDKVAQEY